MRWGWGACGGFLSWYSGGGGVVVVGWGHGRGVVGWRGEMQAPSGEEDEVGVHGVWELVGAFCLGDSWNEWNWAGDFGGLRMRNENVVFVSYVLFSSCGIWPW